MKRVVSGINFNTLLLAILGFIAEETWRDQHKTNAAVQSLAVTVPYIQQDVAELKRNCVSRDEVARRILEAYRVYHEAEGKRN